jgi:Tol biopolymer transport system component
MKRTILLASTALAAALAAFSVELVEERPASAAFAGLNGQIAFVSDRDGNEEIYVMDANGTGQTRLTDDPYRDVHPAFSPDGEQLTFTSRRPADASDEIYVMDARDTDPQDGNGDHLVKTTGDPPRNFQSVYSPDGSRIAFIRNEPNVNSELIDSELWVMDADGTNQTRLTDNTVNEIRPAFSPAGEHIAFTRRDPNNRDPGKRRDDIYLIDVDDKVETRLTSHAAADTTANFSPDGEKIAFASTRDDASGEIYVMNADGSSTVRLTTNETVDEFPAFSPDGERIAFSSNRDGDAEIFVMNADGTGQTPLTDNPTADFRPDWGPVHHAFSGFLEPVNNLPTTNVVNAGRAIPVKFSLGGDQGLDILAAEYPASQRIECDPGTSADVLEGTASAGDSGLSYDLPTDQYTYVWKTRKSWEGTCRQLVLRLDDATYHRADFRFQ